MSLDDAFRATTFYVRARPEAGLAATIGLRIGAIHSDWEAVLARAGANKWACITAYSPDAKTHSDAENQAAQAELQARYIAKKPKRDRDSRRKHFVAA